MKTSSSAVPVSMTVALTCLLFLNLSCRKQAAPSEVPSEIPTPTATNTAIAPMATTNADVTAPVVAPASEPVNTNPPPAAAEPVTPPAAPEPAPTAPIEPPPVHTIVEMPTNAPVAPTNFYSDAYFADKTNRCTIPKPEARAASDFALLFRAGYQHVNHGDNHDTYWLSVKFGYNGDAWRERASRLGWIVPDADAELAHQYLPKPDDSRSPGAGEGLCFNADFYWPWAHWTSRMFVRTNGADETYLPLRFTLGPTVNLGFDELFDASNARFTRYVGARATLNHGFIEYTAGATEGLKDTRSQVVTELPFYVSRRNNVRYYFRGLWNTGFNHTRDELEAGLFLELPFATLVSPNKWGSLVPGLE